MPTESSVLTNLRELEKLESQRIADEEEQRAAAAEAKAQAAAEAQACALEAEAHARRVAEAEVRLGFEKEQEERQSEAGARIERLRAELAAVQADRQRMDARIATLADDSWATRQPREQSWGWKAAFASAGAVAAGLALILAVREPVAPTRIVEVPVERTVVVERPAAQTGIATPTEERTAEDPTEDEPLAVATPLSADRPPRTPRAGERGARPRMGTMEPDPLGDLDCPDDDPTCGI